MFKFEYIKGLTENFKSLRLIDKDLLDETISLYTSRIAIIH